MGCGRVANTDLRVLQSTRGGVGEGGGREGHTRKRQPHPTAPRFHTQVAACGAPDRLTSEQDHLRSRVEPDPRRALATSHTLTLWSPPHDATRGAARDSANRRHSTCPLCAFTRWQACRGGGAGGTRGWYIGGWAMDSTTQSLCRACVRCHVCASSMSRSRTTYTTPPSHARRVVTERPILDHRSSPTDTGPTVGMSDTSRDVVDTWYLEGSRCQMKMLKSRAPA
jgi:hypothetical protein